MEQELQELIPIVSELARKYTGCDSTSITYEKAQMLMESVLYCLEEYRYSAKNSLEKKGLSIREQYQIGAGQVVEKAQRVRKLYNGMSVYFDDYGVECLGDTIQKGIPEFLKWYDATFCPQDTILTLDYPILRDIHTFTGVDAVYEYLCAIEMEQKFLKRFNKDDITAVLYGAVPYYQQMFENICEIFLINLMGCSIVEKPFSQRGFHSWEYEKLTEFFSQRSLHEIEEKVGSIIEAQVCQGVEDDKKMLEYFNCDVRNIAVRMEGAARNRQLDKLFVL